MEFPFGACAHERRTKPRLECVSNGEENLARSEEGVQKRQHAVFQAPTQAVPAKRKDKSPHAFHWPQRQSRKRAQCIYAKEQANGWKTSSHAAELEENVNAEAIVSHRCLSGSRRGASAVVDTEYREGINLPQQLTFTRTFAVIPAAHRTVPRRELPKTLQDHEAAKAFCS